MSGILKSKPNDCTQHGFDQIFRSIGYWNLNETNAMEHVRQYRPFTFVLISTDSPYEDLLLVFVNSKGVVTTKPIHIMGENPTWKFMNGNLKIHPNLKSLLKEMMDCNLEDLNPLIEPR